MLYSADLRGEDAVAALERVTTDGPAPSNPYSATLVRGVAGQRERIDDLVTAHAQGWTLARMPAVDRNVLRIAVWEMLETDDVPPTVAISEAVALVRDLSTDESPTFVNGVLAAVAETLASATD